MMKRRFFAFFLALAALLLVGCDGGSAGTETSGRETEAPPPLVRPEDTDASTGEPLPEDRETDGVTEEPPLTTETPETDPLPPEEPLGPVASMESDRMSYQAGDGQTVLEYSAGYPVLTGETDAASKKLNDAVVAQLTVLSHEAAMLADSALLHYETSPESFLIAYSFTVYCETYVQAHGLSLVFRITEYDGGPDGRERYVVMLLDSRTGDELKVAEDEEAFWQDVEAAATEALRRTGLELFEDWEEMVGQYVRDCYYFRDGYMGIFFGEYTVAPGVSGVIRVEIDMADVAVHMDGELLGDLLM